MKVTFEQLKAAFNRVLISRGVDSETADACAEMFARTTESGVYSHGVNRFPRFIQQLENGDIIPDAQPKRITSLGAIEQWDAQRSIGNLTAKKQRCRKSGTLLSPVSGRCFFQSSLLAGFAPVCLPLPKPGPLLLSMRCLSPQLFTVK